MPTLAGLRWNPIVTILNPTSAMTEEKQVNVTENAVDNSAFKWVRTKIHPDKKTVETTATSANNHT